MAALVPDSGRGTTGNSSRLNCRIVGPGLWTRADDRTPPRYAWPRNRHAVAGMLATQWQNAVLPAPLVDTGAWTENRKPCHMIAARAKCQLPGSGATSQRYSSWASGERPGKGGYMRRRGRHLRARAGAALSLPVQT